MIAKIKFYVSLCVFGTGYVSFDLQSEILHFYAALIPSIVFLIILNKIHDKSRISKRNQPIDRS